MDNSAVKAIIIALISAAVGALLNQKTTTIQAATTIPMTAWLLFQFRTLEKAWKSLGLLRNPILSGINAFFASFIYLSWNTVPLMKAIYLSTGVFLLGGVLGTLMYKYWNIGH
ncbi:hypothetical protein [Candidatus Nanohalobium constans]|uniref:Uncharacterized protein n=1 Tax=Candidatus Nanohalobium constans TaxID=2565781 RepID=A0A5Q0UG53_9ARCH|nr:hypothetical protein [Candidatus Nanohalobium constans]QGA80544.1 hypothetical protein LC1Nh_0653 [Candidatus Nanohalobium constans]